MATIRFPNEPGKFEPPGAGSGRLTRADQPRALPAFVVAPA